MNARCRQVANPPPSVILVIYVPPLPCPHAIISSHCPLSLFTLYPLPLSYRYPLPLPCLSSYLHPYPTLFFYLTSHLTFSPPYTLTPTFPHPLYTLPPLIVPSLLPPLPQLHLWVLHHYWTNITPPPLPCSPPLQMLRYLT